MTWVFVLVVQALSIFTMVYQMFAIRHLRGWVQYLAFMNHERRRGPQAMNQTVDEGWCFMCNQAIHDDEPGMTIPVVRESGSEMRAVHKLCILIEVVGETKAREIWSSKLN